MYLKYLVHHAYFFCSVFYEQALKNPDLIKESQLKQCCHG